MTKPKIGLVGVYQENFPGDKEGQFKRSIRELEDLASSLGFDFFPIAQGVLTVEDSQAARRKLEAEKVDFVLVQTTSFAAGENIIPLAQMDAYLGLWAVPEGAEIGPLPLNSFCGMNLYASIIGHYLKRYDILYKWFYGNTDSELFLPRFRITLAALRAVKNLRGSKIGLVGGIAPGFSNLYFDERELEKRFGVRIFRHELSEVLNRARNTNRSTVQSVANRMRSESSSCHVVEEDLHKAASVYLALSNIAKENSYCALAVSCWPKFQEEYNFVPCSVLGRLNDEGIVASCEGDVPSAISMIMLNSLSKKPSTMMDLIKFDEVDETILLWHCGVAPKGYGQIKLDTHYKRMVIEKGKPVRPMGVVRDVVLKSDQDVTLIGFTQEGETMLVLAGCTLGEEKGSFDGSRGWLSSLRLNGKEIRIRDLIEILFFYRLRHHYALGLGNLTDEVMETIHWLGIRPLEKKSYQKYMQNPAI